MGHSTLLLIRVRESVGLSLGPWQRYGLVVGVGRMEELEEDHGEGVSGLQVRLYVSELGFV